MSPITMEFNTTKIVSTSQRCFRWSNVNSSPNESARTFCPLDDASHRLWIICTIRPRTCPSLSRGRGIRCVPGMYHPRDALSKGRNVHVLSFGDTSSWHLSDLELDSVRSLIFLVRGWIWTHNFSSWIQINILPFHVRNLDAYRTIFLWQNFRTDRILYLPVHNYENQ